MSPLTRQQRQALTMLRVAGRRGVHSFDMRHAGIGNPSQRVAELVDLGVVVTRQRERLRAAVGVRWTLVSAPSSLTEPVSESPPSSPPPAPGGPAPGGGDSGTGTQLDLLGGGRHAA